MELEKALNRVTESQDEFIQDKTRELKIQKILGKLSDLGLNLDELQHILLAKDNILISSCAGSGKTTALILKLITALVAGDYITKKKTVGLAATSEYTVNKKIFVGTFLKTGAEELKKSFYYWCDRLGISNLDISNIKFSTLHAEFYDALKTLGVPINIQESSDLMVKTVLKDLSIHNPNSKDGSFCYEDIKDIKAMITYIRNRLDEKRYDHPLMEEYNIDVFLIKVLLQKLKEQRTIQLNAFDFEDIQELLYKYAGENDQISKFLSSRYDVMMLDEFQDTSQIQYAILQHYFKGVEQIVAIGDDDQTIYSWRGSDINIINKKFEEEIKPTILALSTNYRCKANILNPIINSISQNTNRRPKNLVSGVEGGNVKIVYDFKKWEYMLRLMESGEKYAVLSRTNYDLLIPTILLELNAETTYKAPRNLSLEKSVIRTIIAMLNLVRFNMDNSFRKIFGLFVPYYKRHEIEKLLNVLCNNPDMSIFNIDLYDVRVSCSELYPLISGMQEEYKNAINQGKGEDEARKAALIFLVIYTREIFAEKQGNYCKHMTEFMDFMTFILTNTEFGYANKSLEYYTILFVNVLQGSIESHKGTQNAQFELLTVHEAKGKEWDNVIIWNDVDGTFPIMINSRDLDTAEYEEERRIHYIAWTRAKNKLIVLTDLINQSPFLMETGLECEM